MLSEEIMRMYNIQLRWSSTKHISAGAGDIVEFECQHGYRRKTPLHTFRATCQEGKLTYPVCG